MWRVSPFSRTRRTDSSRYSTAESQFFSSCSHRQMTVWMLWSEKSRRVVYRSLLVEWGRNHYDVVSFGFLLCTFSFHLFLHRLVWIEGLIHNDAILSPSECCIEDKHSFPFQRHASFHSSFHGRSFRFVLRSIGNQTVSRLLCIRITQISPRRVLPFQTWMSRRQWHQTEDGRGHQIRRRVVVYLTQ